MKAAQRLTAIIEPDHDGFVALCPELDIASQDASIEDAPIDLIEALTLFLETATLPRSLTASVMRFSSLQSRWLGRFRALSCSEVAGFGAVRQQGIAGVSIDSPRSRVGPMYA